MTDLPPDRESVARHLEENGIPTVVVGVAPDIVEHCGVPRFVASDLPLGNPCGRPFDPAMQRGIVECALSLLEDARAPRTTITTPFRFAADDAWRREYLRIDDVPAATLREAGRRRRAAQERDRREGRARTD